MYNNHIFWNYYVRILLNLYCFSQIELVQNYSPLFSTNRTSSAVDLWLNVENIEEFSVVIYNDYHSEKQSMNIIIIVLLLSYNG